MLTPAVTCFGNRALGLLVSRTALGAAHPKETAYVTPVLKTVPITDLTPQDLHAQLTETVWQVWHARWQILLGRWLHFEGQCAHFAIRRYGHASITLQQFHNRSRPVMLFDC